MCVILSIDVGTGSVKAGLLDTRTAQWMCLASHSLSTYRSDVIAEQDAREYVSAAELCVRELGTTCPGGLDRVRAIGLTGQMRGLVLVDAEHRPLGPVLTLYDRRAEREYAEFIAEFGLERIYRVTGQRFDVAGAPARLRWLARHMPDRLTGCWKILAPKDYLRFCLTGRAATEPIDAGGWLLYDLIRGEWHEELTAFARVRMEQLPAIVPACSIAGTLLPEVADAWGISPDTPVCVGAGDDIAATGCGVSKPGDVYEHLGSTGSIFVLSDSVVLDPDMIVECYPTESAGKYWIGGSCNSAGIAIEHALRMSAFCHESRIDWPVVFRALGDWHVKSPGERPMYLPYVAGERCPVWDARLRAAWLDKDLAHSPADWAVAAHEGPACVLAWIRQELQRLGFACASIYSAGRAGRDESFMRLRATVYGCPVLRQQQEDAALLAAAGLAAVAVGETILGADMSRNTEAVCSAEPVVERVSEYVERLMVFQRRTRDHLHMLAGS